MTALQPAIAGGVLVGVGLLLALLAAGRPVGMSGILAGVLSPRRGDTAWRVAFVGGLLLGGFVVRWLSPATLAFDVTRAPLTVAAAGLLVGFGTRLGGGCTSGHGVCGVARLSLRSIVAAALFVAAGMAVVGVMKRLGGLS